mgnify:CR=1 FL=1
MLGAILYTFLHLAIALSRMARRIGRVLLGSQAWPRLLLLLLDAWLRHRLKSQVTLALLLLGRLARNRGSLSVGLGLLLLLRNLWRLRLVLLQLGRGRRRRRLLLL